LKSKSNGKILFFLAKFCFTGAIITVFFHWFDSQRISQILLSSKVQWIQTAVILTLCSPLLASLRLRVFLNLSQIRISFANCLLVTFVGLALNLFMPARGGDIAKFFFLRNIDKCNSKSTLSGAAILERISDLFALSLLGLLGSIFTSHKSITIISVLVILASILLAITLSKSKFLPLVGYRLSSLAETIQFAYKQKIKLIFGLGTSLGFWILVSSIMACLLKAIDQSISYMHCVTVSPPSILVGALPVSLWGVGTRDGALAYLLKDLTSIESALAAGFLYIALVYWLLGLIGVPALLYSRKSREVINQV
jgi:uncharacterized membrane protein YbhN (UPF0104 family)